MPCDSTQPKPRASPLRSQERLAPAAVSPSARHGVPAHLSPAIETPKISSMTVRESGSALVAVATSLPFCKTRMLVGKRMGNGQIVKHDDDQQTPGSSQLAGVPQQCQLMADVEAGDGFVQQ